MTVSMGLLLLANSILFTCVSGFGEPGGMHAMSLNRSIAFVEGSLDIRLHPGGRALHPPADLLLEGPAGRRTGYDPVTKSRLSAIPHSSLETEGIDDDVTGAPGPRSLVLFVGDPAGGVYRLQVIATRSGTYTLEVQGYDVEMEPSNKAFPNREISKGATHLYLILFSTQAGEGITVTYAGSPEVQR